MKKYILIGLIIALFVSIPCFAQGPPSNPLAGTRLRLLESIAPGASSNSMYLYVDANNNPYVIDEDGNAYSVYISDPNITVTATALNNDIVDPNHLADADWGDGSVSSGSFTLDADVVGPAELADGDYGDVIMSSGAITVDPDEDIEANSFIATSGIYADVSSTYGISEAGVLTISSMSIDPTADPSWTFNDSDAAGADAADEDAGSIWANMTTTTEDGEISDIGLDALISGSDVHVAEWDGSDESWTLGDSVTGEDLIIDFETATDNEVSVNTNSGVTQINFNAISLLTSGILTGKTESRILTNCEGAHDGDNNAAVLSDSGESFTVDGYIGMTLYNLTDVSSGVITDNDGTTITCTLTGGTDNDWDTGDSWAVAPGPYQSGMIWYITSATTILHPATAYYVAGYFAGGAVRVTIDPQSDSMTINFSDDGVYTDPGAGDEVESDETQGDFIWIHNASTTEAYSHGVNGSWADGGAS